MRLRKLKIDNSVKYVRKASSSQSEDSSRDPKPKAASLPRKQNRKRSQNNENVLKNNREGLKIIEG